MTSTKPKRRKRVQRSNKITKETVIKNLKEMFTNSGYPYSFGSMTVEDTVKLRQAMIDVSKDEDFWTAIRQMFGHYELAREIAKSLKGGK